MKLIIPKIACLKVEQGSLLHLQYHILVLCITWYHGRNNQLKYWNLTQTKSNPLRNCYQLQQDLLTSISTCYYLILQVLILPLNIYIYIYIYILYHPSPEILLKGDVPNFPNDADATALVSLKNLIPHCTQKLKRWNDNVTKLYDSEVDIIYY